MLPGGCPIHDFLNALGDASSGLVLCKPNFCERISYQRMADLIHAKAPKRRKSIAFKRPDPFPLVLGVPPSWRILFPHLVCSILERRDFKCIDCFGGWIAPLL